MTWVTILHQSKREYYVKYNIVKSEYVFYITNLVCLWEKRFLESELLYTIQHSNPLLEGDSTKLIPQCLDLLFSCLSQNNADTSIEFKEETKDINLNIKTRDGKFPFRIKLEFKLCTAMKFYEEVTSSLIVMIKELKDSENQLIECLVKKDAEVQDYKAEGACLSLKHLETKVFNRHEHQQLYTPSSDSSFSYNDLVSIVTSNSCIKEDSTPKHSIIHKCDSASSVKKEFKEMSDIQSSTSSPVSQTGIAPILVQSEGNIKEDPEQNLLRLGKRKNTIRKQLNL